MGFDQPQQQEQWLPENQNYMPHSSNPYVQPEPQQQQQEPKNISDLMATDYKK